MNGLIVTQYAFGWTRRATGLAAIEDMPTVSAFGESPSEALRELACAWEGLKDSYIASMAIPSLPQQSSTVRWLNQALLLVLVVPDPG
jgi:predicted RNase H-like HicB family nuclease